MLEVKTSITTQHLFAAIALSIIITACSSQAFAQTQDGFVPLFSGESLDGWVVENSKGDNFYVNDSILRVEEPEGWLRSE